MPRVQRFIIGHRRLLRRTSSTAEMGTEYAGTETTTPVRTLEYPEQSVRTIVGLSMALAGCAASPSRSSTSDGGPTDATSDPDQPLAARNETSTAPADAAYESAVADGGPWLDGSCPYQTESLMDSAVAEAAALSADASATRVRQKAIGRARQCAARWPAPPAMPPCARRPPSRTLRYGARRIRCAPPGRMVDVSAYEWRPTELPDRMFVRPVLQR
jgi:hypothetical protein